MKSEKDLAAELGIDRKELKDMRASISGWSKKGNTIMWDSTGEHTVRNRIQAKICAEDLGEPLEVPKEKEMKITKIPLNPKLVVCGDVYVRVRDNRNFINGMKVRARPPADGSRCWVLLGRCPRWRGKY